MSEIILGLISALLIVFTTDLISRRNNERAIEHRITLLEKISEKLTMTVESFKEFKKRLDVLEERMKRFENKIDCLLLKEVNKDGK